MQETMKEWALKYADLGLAVFPLRPRDKRPATENGCKAATINKQQISDWWDRYPDCNIGIATGSKSGGLLVIDLDEDEEKDKHGYEVLKEWQREHEELPETWQSITGRGGYHFFFRDSAENRNRTGLYDGIDIRGEGGYIVAPPSLHPNGRRYEWEQGPGDCEIAQANTTVINFLMGPEPENLERQTFTAPETIPDGQRHSVLISLIGSLKSKGLDDETIRAAVRSENDRKCRPPLTDQELEKTIFPALKRGWQPTSPYYTSVPDGGKTRQVKNHSLEMVRMSEAEEKEAEWLICGYMPRFQITSLAGDGGSGKTTVWCAIAAAISTGGKTFLEDMIPNGIGITDPQKVMFFSAEDSFEYTLKRRLRKNGANLDNILSIDIADDRFQDIKFNSPYLESLLEAHRPVLCIFDPIQAFVPPDIRMGDRNAMRNCLAPLIGYGEKYGVTFLIVEHANKQSGVWGRKRIADSADIWDISRSVIMAGETNERGVRYLSHEKSNYGPTSDSILYTIEDEVIQFKGYTNKKDKDFVSETDYNSRQMPQKEEAKEFILEFLKDGEKEVSELDEMAAAMSISKNALKNAKAELKKEGKTKTWCIGFNPKRFYISLIAS